MSTVTKEQVIQYLENLTLLEASELVKELETKFGVSAAALAVARDGAAVGVAGVGLLVGFGGRDGFGVRDRAQVNRPARSVSPVPGRTVEGEMVGVDDGEFEFRAHRKVLLQDSPLKNSEALVGISREAQVHPRSSL